MIPTWLGVILLVFFLFKYFGGDPAEILGGLNASKEQIQAIRQQLGLNDPVWYHWIFVKQIVTFNRGNSWATNEAVTNIFATRLPATLTVMTPILILDEAPSTIAAMESPTRGTLTDRAIMVITRGAVHQLPGHIIVGQYVFGFQLGWFPVQGWSDSTGHQPGGLRRCRCCWRWPWAWRRRHACTAASSSTNWARTTCAPPAPRA